MSLPTLSKKSFFAVAIGTVLEYYDFGLWPIFFPLLAPVFFPGDSAYHALVIGYQLALITFFARPLGGLVFGHFGDRWGRRRALLISLYGIALSTLIIGILPSYAKIGIVTTVIVIIARFAQSFFYGGEYNGAGTYVTEHAEHR